MSQRILLLTLLAVFAAATAAEARIYRWVDESGAHHFTDRPEEVPARFRDQLLLDEDPASTSPAKFVVVPGLGQRPVEGEEIQPIDEAAFEAEALAALQNLQGDQRGAVLEMLAQAASQMLPYLIVGGLVALLIVSAFGAILLLVSCKICGADRPGFGKGMGIVVLQMLAGLALGVLILLVAGSEAQQPSIQAGQFGLSFVVQAAVLRGLHLDAMGKALIVTGVMTLLSIGLAVLFVIAAFCAGVGAGLSG